MIPPLNTYTAARLSSGNDYPDRVVTLLIPYGTVSPNIHPPYPTTRLREPAVSAELHNESRAMMPAAGVLAVSR